MRRPKHSLHPKNGGLQCSIYFQKKRYKRTFRTTSKREANRLAEEFKNEIIRQIMSVGFLMDEQPASIVFEAYNETLTKSGRPKSPQTIQNYKAYAERFKERLQDIPLLFVTKQQVETWRDWLLKQKKKNGQKGTLEEKCVSEHLNWLSAVYNQYDDSFPTNPCKRVVRPRKPQTQRIEDMKFYTESQTKAMMGASFKMVKEEWDGGKIEGNRYLWNLWFRLLVFTGTRRGELQGLTFGQVNWQTKSVMVKSAKTLKYRSLMLVGEGGATFAWRILNKLADIALWSYMTDEEKEQYPSVPTTRSRPRYRLGKGRQVYELDYKTLAPLLEKYKNRTIYTKYRNWMLRELNVLCKKVKVPPKGLHAIRHSFATVALHRNWEIAQLSQWLGHASITETVDTYGHLLKKEPPRIWFTSE